MYKWTNVRASTTNKIGKVDICSKFKLKDDDSETKTKFFTEYLEIKLDGVVETCSLWHEVQEVNSVVYRTDRTERMTRVYSNSLLIIDLFGI